MEYENEEEEKFLERVLSMPQEEIQLKK